MLTARALDDLGAQRVALATDELDAGSLAVALRCGFRLEGIRRYAARSPDGRTRSTCLNARLPDAG